MVITARQRSCGKVMFSAVSVRQSVILSMGVSHVTNSHNAFDLTIQGPLLWSSLLPYRAPGPSPDMFKLVQPLLDIMVGYES